MEQVFCQNFTASQQGIGEVLSVPLCLDGDEKMVTEESRREYVELYINHVLNSSVHRQVHLIFWKSKIATWLNIVLKNIYFYTPLLSPAFPQPCLSRDSVLVNVSLLGLRGKLLI